MPIIGGQNAQHKLYNQKAIFQHSFQHFSTFYCDFILRDKSILLQFLPDFTKTFLPAYWT